MILTILATANHFLLDAIVGAFIPVLAWRISEIFLVLRPLEELMFGLARTMKPLSADEDPVAYKMAPKMVDDGHEDT
jgi:hypothetical protein